MISIDKLLNPISEKNPTGTDLRNNTNADAIYYAIKDARHQARYAEKQEETHKSLESWETVLMLAQKILTEDSKDFEITSWLLEALLRKHQFAGLSTGLQLTRELIEQYWENSFPTLEDLPTKVAGFTALNGLGKPGTLIMPILNTPITEAPNAFASWQYQEALTHSPGLLNQIQQAAAQSSEAFIKHLKQTILDCQDSFKQLSQAFDQRCHHESPPSSNISTVLQSVAESIQALYPQQEHPPATHTEQPALSMARTIPSREIAFRQLQAIADFFKEHEPHSPLPYLIKRTIDWGQLSFPDLLKEMIHDSHARDSAYELTGIHNTH